MGYLKAVILLSNGKDFCPYIKDFKCTIYEERPSICKSYPLSTNIDNILYHDINCPGISNSGFELVKNGKISEHFKTFIFDDYQTKYIKTHEELEKFNKKEDFSIVTIINGKEFYKYTKKASNNYITMHQDSLNNLKKYNL